MALVSVSVLPEVDKLFARPQNYTREQLTGIARINADPSMLVVRADAPWKTLKDMLEAAKKEPGKIRVGSPGVGTTVHIAIEILKDKAGVDLTHVPFAGNAESVPALLGGHVEAIMLHPSDVIPHMRAGKARFLATSETRRSTVYPDVPTFAEQGLAEAGIGVYYIVIAPKATPAPVLQTVHDAIKKTIETDAFKKFALETSALVEYRGPAELKKQLETEYVFFGRVVEKLKLKR